MFYLLEEELRSPHLLVQNYSIRYMLIHLANQRLYSA